MVTLSASELERLVVVASDLEFLERVGSAGIPSHTDIRLAAGVLRRLLIENQLSHGCRPISSAVGDLSIAVNDLDETLDETLDEFESRGSPEWLIYAWAGGGNWEGMMASHDGFVLASVPKAEWSAYGTPDAFLAAVDLRLRPAENQHSPGRILSSTAIAYRHEGTNLRIPRREVIKYIANRKGGVHFDPSRKIKPEAKATKRKSVLFAQIMDLGLIRVGPLSGPEYEIAALIASVTQAPWSSKIRLIAAEAAPQDFVDNSELQFWSPEGRWETMTFGSE
jgi:hypothetical protein